VQCAREEGVWVTILNEIVINFVEKLTFEQRSEGMRELLMDICRQDFPSRGDSQHKGPRQQRGGQCDWNDRKRQVAGDQVREGTETGPVRSHRMSLRP
jgi:hypothetical protein